MSAAVLPVRHRWRDALVFSADDRIDVYGLAVATALHVHMGPDGRCKVGQRRLAELARCTQNTVRARIGVLVAAGWLAVEGGDRERASYRAVIPPSEAPDETPAGPVDNAAGRVGSASPDGRCRPRSAARDEARSPVTMNPSRPRPRRSPSGWHDPSVGRPPPGRPAVELGELVEADDGTLWVSL